MIVAVSGIGAASFDSMGVSGKNLLKEVNKHKYVCQVIEENELLG